MTPPLSAWDEARARRAYLEQKRTGKQPVGLPWPIEQRALIYAMAELFGRTVEEQQQRFDAKCAQLEREKERGA
jgi:hypothetical protein